MRKTGSGTAVVDLGLALNDEYTARDGKVVPQTCFADVVVWGKSAEAVNAHLKKGDPALVEGGLVTEQWETPQGQKRNRLRIRATRVHFLKPRGNSGNGGDAAPAPADDPFA